MGAPTATRHASGDGVAVERSPRELPDTVEAFAGLEAGERKRAGPTTAATDPPSDGTAFASVAESVARTAIPSGTGRSDPGPGFDDERVHNDPHAVAGLRE